MINVMEFDGFNAVIIYDPDIKMFRGEFVGLNGGADFYASDIAGLEREGRTSLEVFLQMCVEDDVSPHKTNPRSVRDYVAQTFQAVA